jgi:hypothetical protein
VLWEVFRERTGICLEDALITYRYAENLALGRGFTFNPGERVLGTTTPAWTLCLALPGFLVGTHLIPLISSFLCAALCLTAGWFTFLTLLGCGVSRTVATVTALLLLTSPEVVVAATGGMETALLIACMMGSLCAFSLGSHRAAAVLCALVVLTRVDGIVWAGIVLLAIFLHDRRRFLSRLSVFVLTLLPWVAFATWYFGSPVPHSVAAKRSVVYAEDAGMAPLENLLAHLEWYSRASGVRSAYLWAFADDAPWMQVAVVAAFGFLFVGGVRHAFGSKALLPFAVVVVFPFALGVAYWIGRAPRRFDWYLTPPLWCSTVVVGLGIERWFRNLREAFRS